MSTTTAPQETAFDPTVYDLPIPTRDGHKADRIVVSFSGQLDLDRTSADDLDFVNDLTLGKRFTTTVELVVTKAGGFTFTPGKDEETPDTTGYGVGVKVVSIET